MDILGLDFIFGDKLYLLEINSAPGGINYITKNKCFKKSIKKLSSKFDKINFYKVYENVEKFVELKEIFEENGIEVFWNEKPNKKIPLFTRLKIKRELYPKGYLFVNSLFISEIANDKWLTYSLFPDISPKTFRADLYDNSLSKFVLKPRFGEKGKNIQILNKIPKNIEKKRYVVQELIEPRKIFDEFWDIRAYIIGGRYAGSFIRKSKDFVVNISKGGSIEKIDKNLEREIKNIIKKEIIKKIH